MSRNVEIKAYCKDLESAKAKILTLKSLANHTDNDIVVMEQEDVFYNLPADRAGKLKLRKIKGCPPELIYYDREESTGPKLSNYRKCYVPPELEDILTNSLSTRGVVKKVRTLIMFDQTRLHFDQVEGLGDFLEFEVVLSESQTVEYGQNIANDLMLHLGINEKDLISVAYIDMLNQK